MDTHGLERLECSVEVTGNLKCVYEYVVGDVIYVTGTQPDLPLQLGSSEVNCFKTDQV